jgi:hypothetical protein
MLLQMVALATRILGSRTHIPFDTCDRCDMTQLTCVESNLCQLSIGLDTCQWGHVTITTRAKWEVCSKIISSSSVEWFWNKVSFFNIDLCFWYHLLLQSMLLQTSFSRVVPKLLYPFFNRPKVVPKNVWFQI